MGGMHRYIVAFGSNRRHFTIGSPRQVMGAASIEFDKAGIAIVRAGALMQSRPIGPSRHTYYNSAVVVETDLEPEELLDFVKGLERKFGRRPGGQRWAERVLDLDIVLWSGGSWASDRLTIPHPEFRERAFVLKPAARIAPGWRDPLTGLTLRQLYARLTAPRPLPR